MTAALLYHDAPQMSLCCCCCIAQRSKFELLLCKRICLRHTRDILLLDTCRINFLHSLLHHATYICHLPIISVRLQDAIFEQPDLTRAMTNVYNLTRDFMMRVYGLNENEVLTAMGIGIDMGITQVNNTQPSSLHAMHFDSAVAAE